MKYDRIWYKSLKKPNFQPSEKVFPIVWGILYILMAISFFKILVAPISILKIIAILVFLIQLIINLMWIKIFFQDHKLKESFKLTVFLVVYLLITIILFYQVSIIASFLLIPYLLWCIFAAFLMYKIYKLNT